MFSATCDWFCTDGSSTDSILQRFLNICAAQELRVGQCAPLSQKSLKLNITNIINGTPDIILDKIDTHSLNGFTNYVKLFLLQTYQDTCTVPNCYICSLSNTLTL